MVIVNKKYCHCRNDDIDTTLKLLHNRAEAFFIAVVEVIIYGPKSHR